MVAALAAIRKTPRLQKGAPRGQSDDSSNFVKTKLMQLAAFQATNGPETSESFDPRP
jgi:hypothetical protein